MLDMSKPSSSTLYQIISTAFCVIVVISNIISAKMITLPYPQNFIIPAGLITYPLTFLLSDLVTEIFGAHKAKLMVYITLVMNLLSLSLIQLALWLPTPVEGDQVAFQLILGLSGLRIFASLVAYIISQIVDIQLYAWIKNWTGSPLLWLRNNGSTCVSQLVDTVMIDMIYLYWGLGMTFKEVLPIMGISYAYKAFFSFASTPLFYLSVYLLKKNWKISPLSIPSKQNQGNLYESNL